MHSWFQDSVLITSKLGLSLIFSGSSLRRGNCELSWRPCRLVPHLGSFGGLKCLKDTLHQSHSHICKGSNRFNLWVEVLLVYTLRIDASVYALGYRYLEFSISEVGRSYTLWRWQGVRRKREPSNQPREEIQDGGVCKMWSSHLQHKLGQRTPPWVIWSSLDSLANI